jgi:hypothetical protein
MTMTCAVSESAAVVTCVRVQVRSYPNSLVALDFAAGEAAAAVAASAVAAAAAL